MTKVVLGVTGSVAGIKVAELVQQLSDGGAQVRVACSKHGAVFIEQPQQGHTTPAYYSDDDDYKQVLGRKQQQQQQAHVSRKTVYEDHADTKRTSADGADPQCTVPPCSSAEGETNCASEAASKSSTLVPLHVELAEWGDVLLIAPLSANTMAKLALGLCDNLVSRIFRCWHTCKLVVVAPAMNTKMWQHAATSRHVEELQAFGVRVMSPVAKQLACGDVGVGAMAAAHDIAAAALQEARQTNR